MDIPVFSQKHCPVCGRKTNHRRDLVPLAEIEPAEHARHVTIGDKAIMPLVCLEHDAQSSAPRSQV